MNLFLVLKHHCAWGWHMARVIVAEWFIVAALGIMPDGEERDQLEGKLYDYFLWVKENS